MRISISPPSSLAIPEHFKISDEAESFLKLLSYLLKPWPRDSSVSNPTGYVSSSVRPIDDLCAIRIVTRITDDAAITTENHWRKFFLATARR